MGRRKLSPGEIVERLQAIDALSEDGRPLEEAIRLGGLFPDEYERWRSEYAGVLRTLRPLAGPPPKRVKKPGRPGRAQRNK
jgi:hypothetical protein